jgi:chorismate synthase
MAARRGMALSAADIQHDLDRRRPGTSRHVTQRNEPDEVEILSVVLRGQDHRRPDCAADPQQDQRSKDYGNILKPSARGMPTTPTGTSTASATTAAAVVRRRATAAMRWRPVRSPRKWLKERHGIDIHGCMSQLGPLRISYP